MRARLTHDNPSPFRQPYLVLRVRRGKRARWVDWWIDVDSQIHLYIRPWRPEEPTELLLELCRLLTSHGYVVGKYNSYVGSAGPSHILRNGALFRRMHDTFEQDADPDPAGKTVQHFTPPVYNRAIG